MNKTGSSTGRSFWQRHGHKSGALIFWLVVLGSYQWYAWRNQLSPLEAVQRMLDLLRSGPGPLIYLAVYMLRPLVLFPATIMTLAGGFVFGPFLGLVYSTLGSNASAMVAYLVGRFFGTGAFDHHDASSVMDTYIERMRQNSFMSIMTMRLILLPYDLVNYLAGFLKIDWKPFLLATVLGSIPGSLAVVLLGSSIKGELTALGDLELNPWVLATSLILLVASLAISRYFKQREDQGSGIRDQGSGG